MERCFSYGKIQWSYDESTRLFIFLHVQWIWLFLHWLFLSFLVLKSIFFFQNYLKEILSIGVYILSLWDLSQQAVTDWHFDIPESQVSTRYWMVAFWRMLPHYITERRESLWLASAYQKYEVIYFVVMIKYGDWRKK